MDAVPYNHCNAVNVGDLQSDGSIDILDVISMVSCILDSHDEVENCICHDMNDDCILNILDIIRLLLIILGE
ncbi:MAG: hypothetical protein ACE5D7_06145 [Fidelibacterota bacterium]